MTRREVYVNDGFVSFFSEVLKEMRGISGPVFRYGPDGLGDFKKGFRGAVRRAKIRHCTPHCMRHTFATRLVLAGVDIVNVQDLLGHADITTPRKYAHPNPSHKQAAVEKLTDSKKVTKAIDNDAVNFSATDSGAFSSSFEGRFVSDNPTRPDRYSQIN
jgi:integrase